MARHRVPHYPEAPPVLVRIVAWVEGCAESIFPTIKKKVYKI